MAPKDENELRHMLYTAVALKSPVAIRYPRGGGVGVPLDYPLRKLAIGEAEEVKAGNAVVFLAVGAMVETCRAASEILLSSSIRAGVVNTRFVKPLDTQMLTKLAHEANLIVTVEDNVLAGGFGSSVLEYMNSQHFNWVKVLRLGLPDQFIEHGTRVQLLEKYGLTATRIAEEVKAFVRQSEMRGKNG